MRPIKKRKKTRSKSRRSASISKLPPPYQRALRDSILSAVGTAGLSGCWSIEIPPCDDPAPLINEEQMSNGYQLCSDGRMLKSTSAQCTPREEIPCDEEDQAGCGESTDEDAYTTSCITDQDCDGGSVCLCERLGGGICVTSNCATNDECDSGQCEVTTLASGGGCGDGFWSGNQVVTCRDPELDECNVDADCGWGADCVTRLSDDGGARRLCSIDKPTTPGVVCGRPIREDGGVLEAPLVTGSGWSAEMDRVQEQLKSLAPEVHATLLQRWEMIAQLEHSSVASFARVVLELMALGAPADLLLETQNAAHDEVIHAQLALDVVSALRGEQVSFGPFPSDRLSLRTDRDQVLVSLIEEACLGETLGVVEAEGELALMRGAGGPEALCARLARVIEDEARHATLAWRTFAWLLNGDEPSDAERSRRCDLAVSALLSTTRQMIDVEVRSDVRREVTATSVGLLSEMKRAQLKIQGLREVVVPAVVALLGSHESTPLIQLTRYLTRELA